MITLEQLQQPLGEFSMQIQRLKIRRGLTLLVGTNGAGKTTLLELLATLQLPREGTILYRQRTAADDLPLLRSQIGYVPAEIELYEEMTVLRLLSYLADLKGVYRLDRIDDLLREFRLGEYRKTKIKHLSLGVRRRIAIVQSLLAAPYYLFLDEPLNGMDAAERKMTINYLSCYAADHTVIAAVHELSEWEFAADHMVWLDGGKVLFAGEKNQWAADLTMRIWEGVISADQFSLCADHDLIHFRGVPDGVSVHMIAREKPFPELKEVEPTMEDAYFIRRRGLNEV